jgi:hypothetical protein
MYGATPTKDYIWASNGNTCHLWGYGTAMDATHTHKSLSIRGDVAFGLTRTSGRLSVHMSNCVH